MKDLAVAVRKYISRYLVGKRDIVDIDETKDLIYELTREDLWEIRISNEDGLETKIIANLI